MIFTFVVPTHYALRALEPVRAPSSLTTAPTPSPSFTVVEKKPPPVLGMAALSSGAAFVNHQLGFGGFFGAELGVAYRFTAMNGPFYIGIGALYRGQRFSPGQLDLFAGELLLRSTVPLELAFVFGSVWVKNTSFDSSGSFVYGMRGSWDAKLAGDWLTIGPTAALFDFGSAGRMVTDLELGAALKFWL